MSLKKLRHSIDQIDRKLLSLLNERAALTIRVGKLKKKKGERSSTRPGNGRFTKE